MPPMACPTWTSPITLSERLLTFLKSSRFAGMTSFRVVFRSGSLDVEYARAATEGIGRNIDGFGGQLRHTRNHKQ